MGEENYQFRICFSGKVPIRKRVNTFQTKTKTGPNYYYTKGNPICNLRDAGRNEVYIRLYETIITIIIVEFKLYKIKYLKITYNSEEAHM